MFYTVHKFPYGHSYGEIGKIHELQCIWFVSY